MEQINEFEVGEMVYWKSPHSGNTTEMNYRGMMGSKAMLFNPKSGMQILVEMNQITHMGVGHE